MRRFRSDAGSQAPMATTSSGCTLWSPLDLAHVILPARELIRFHPRRHARTYTAAGGRRYYDTRGFFRGNWPALWRDDLRPPGTRRLSMTRLGEALLDVDDPPVEALLIYASNPMASVPDQMRVR